MEARILPKDTVIKHRDNGRAKKFRVPLLDSCQHFTVLLTHIVGSYTDF